MSSLLSDKKIVKSLIAGGCTVAIDKLYFKSTDTKSILVVGGVVAGSTYLASILSPKYTVSNYKNSMISAKTVQERVLEIGLSTAGAFLINKYMFDILKSDFSLKDSLILFSSASIVSDYASDFIFQEKLSYLS